MYGIKKIFQILGGHGLTQPQQILRLFILVRIIGFFCIINCFAIAASIFGGSVQNTLFNIFMLIFNLYLVYSYQKQFKQLTKIQKGN